MSRASRRVRARRAAENATPAAAPQIVDPATGASLSPQGFLQSGWDGANRSERRGYIYYPTLDTRRDLDSYSRTELMRRAFWLYANVGFARRCVRGIANMVGSLTPVPLTSDKEWNALALKSFENDCGSAEVFDQAGKVDFWRAQPMLTRRRLLAGDHLAVLTKSQTGEARCMFYGSSQVRNGLAGGTDWTNGWIDGVRVNAQTKALAYRVCAPDSTDPLDLAAFEDIPAQDAILHCDYEDTGRVRGESILSHAANNLVDSTEILGFLKQGSKAAAQIGYYIARQLTGPPMGVGAAMGTVNTPLNNRGTTGKALVEDAFRGGKIPEMNPGEDIKMLLDQRPHPNTLGMLDHMATDISWGTDFNPYVLWNIVKLGGATMRFALADAQVPIERIQYLMAEQFCARWWIYYLACKMNVGRLRRCLDPQWWLHGWQPQAKLTVDIARDGKLAIDMHQAGMITLKRWHASLGNAYWQTEVDEYLDERLYIKQGVSRRGLTMAEAYPPRAGVANVTAREEIAMPASDDEEAETGV